MNPPDWLPSPLDIAEASLETMRKLQSVFRLDFEIGQPTFDQYPVVWDRNPCTTEWGEYELGFWHLVSREDQSTGIRQFELARARLLPWCAPTILNARKGDAKVWDYRLPDNRVKTYIWLEQWNYVVILEKLERLRRGSAVFLISAYNVEGNRTRKQLRKYYDKRENADTAP